MTVDLNHLMELKKHVKGFSIQKSQSGTSDRFEPLQRGGRKSSTMAINTLIN
ncbi:hypothetical protein KIN20_020958, partial [Parelaphostrongylus tenuis]